LKICDDLYRGESVSNRTDPELKRMSLVGIKKVISGSINEITNTFTYTSTNLKTSSAMYITGKDSSASKSVTFTDPLFLTNMQVFMPNTDLCQGKTCQMNIVAMKDPPISKIYNGKIIASTLSISFEQSKIVN
jgi:hypothetical protein